MRQRFWRYEVVIVGLSNGVTPLFTATRHWWRSNADIAFDDLRTLLDHAENQKEASVLDVEIRDRRGNRKR